jgi:hypothetical protein
MNGTASRSKDGTVSGPSSDAKQEANKYVVNVFWSGSDRARSSDRIPYAMQRFLGECEDLYGRLQVGVPRGVAEDSQPSKLLNHSERKLQLKKT